MLLAATFRSVIFQYSYEALLLILIVSGPPVLFASIIGLFVAVFQAATQIQEQTLATAVKMVVVFGTLILMGGWLGGLIYAFGHQIFQNFHKFQ